MRLALVCGTLDVDGLMESVSVSQWDEWLAYSELEPFGPREEQYRAGLICEMIARANGMKPKGSSEPLKASDFFPQTRLGLDRAKEREKEQAYIAMQAQLAEAMRRKQTLAEAAPNGD